MPPSRLPRHTNCHPVSDPRPVPADIIFLASVAGTPSTKTAGSFLFLCKIPLAYCLSCVIRGDHAASLDPRRYGASGDLSTGMLAAGGSDEGARGDGEVRMEGGDSGKEQAASNPVGVVGGYQGGYQS